MDVYDTLEPILTPSKLLAQILDEQKRLQKDVIEQLPNILMSNKPGEISGEYTFLNELEVKDLNAHNANLEV